MKKPSPSPMFGMANQAVKNIKSVTFYSHSKDKDALGYLRLLGPAMKLGVKVIEGMEDDQIFPERVHEGDVVVLQRDFPSHLAEYEEILSLAHHEGKAVILDLDDLLLELPEDHPERKSHYYAKALLPVLRAMMEVDLVTVATPRLRDYVTSFNENVFVLSNYLNDDLWHFRKPAVVSAKNRPLIIGYMGGLSHQPDLDMILPVLLRLNDRYPGMLQFNFWGIRPPAELASFAEVRWYHPDTRQYPDFAAYFQTQTADIFIGPLYDSLFNSGKSPIKYFEYSALGVPGVFSRIGPYSDVITHGKDGLLASSHEEWVDCLTKLIEDRELRLEVATNAQETIESKWLLSKNASRWLEAFQKASGNMEIKSAGSSPFFSIIKSLSNQIREDQEHKSNQISALTDRLHTLAPLVAELGILSPYVKFKLYRRIKKDMSLIRSSGLFDEKWYLDRNSDVARAGVNPLLHFLRHGGLERRDPGPHFSSGWYLDAYEDVRSAGVNPLIHFLKRGLFEGRLTSTEQPPDEFTVPSLLRRVYPIRSMLIPYGSRRERLLRGLGKAISKFFGLFDKSRINRIRQIYKKYGLVSFIEIVAGKARVVFWNNVDTAEELASSWKRQRLIAVVTKRARKITSNWAKFSAKAKLNLFLWTNGIVDLPGSDEPEVSVILLFHNRAEMSLQCLRSLEAGAGDVPFEVVIVDNASTDETGVLLDRIRNAKIVRNAVNNGFGGGCNQGVELAAGKYVLFLNNDARLMPAALRVLVDTLEGEESIGAVGGKLIFPDGRLQEAGSIVWRDGSCAGYGRYDDPFKPEYSYVRDVDFCSGALLLTPRDVFLKMGAFDARYAPAYYEDADYCVGLWRQGYRVVFQPFAVAIHYEFGSSGSARAIALQTEHRQIFVEKWGEYLANFEAPDPARVVEAREHKSDAKRILFIDDRIPDPRLGSGYPRTYRMLEVLAEMGYRVTFFPMQISAFVPDVAEALQRMGIEVLYKKTHGENPNQKIDLEAFLKSRPEYYDIAFVSRPHNMQMVKNMLRTHARRTSIVYDAEAIFTMRELKFRELNGEDISEDEKEECIRAEVSLVNSASVVTTVSKTEKEQFLTYGTSSVHILGHVLEPKPTPARFEERKDILFVGGILIDPSPNSDAVCYFAKQILPLVRQEVECEFYIVGTNRVKDIWDLESDSIHVVGRVDDLTPYYNRSRLFVGPARYSAGIPLKVLEAAAHGLPAVVTPLTALQLGWEENRELLIGHDPVDFARKVINLYTDPGTFYTLRQNALDRVREEYSPKEFCKNIEAVINQAVNEKATYKSEAL